MNLRLSKLQLYILKSCIEKGGSCPTVSLASRQVGLREIVGGSYGCETSQKYGGNKLESITEAGEKLTKNYSTRKHNANKVTRCHFINNKEVYDA